MHFYKSWIPALSHCVSFNSGYSNNPFYNRLDPLIKHASLETKRGGNNLRDDYYRNNIRMLYYN